MVGMNATVLIDHINVLNRQGDQHPDHLYQPGRLGGQLQFGGTAAGDILELEGADAAPDTGRVHINSPVEYFYDGDSNTTPAEQYLIRARQSVAIAVPFIGGYLRDDTIRTVSTATYIPGVFVDGGSSLVASAPGFWAYTFINALHRIANSGNFNLGNALVANIGIVHERNSAGTSTVGTGTTGFSFQPQTRTTLSGAIMRKLIGDIAVSVGPTFGSVTGSESDLGTTTGLRLLAPVAGLGQPSTGLETYDGYVGMDFFAMTHATTGDKVVVRSALADVANNYFLQNNGGSQSDFGGGFILDAGLVQVLSNTLGLSLGSPGGSLQILWDGSQEVHNPITGDNLQIGYASGSHTLSSGAAGGELRLDFPQWKLGANSSIGNGVGVFESPARSTGVGGDWADYNQTAAGSLTINSGIGNAFTWNVNPLSFIIGTGTISGDVATLNVGGMTTSTLDSATSTSGLRATGRTQQRGTIQYPPINPANLAGNVDAWSGLLTGSQNNGGRYWARITCDAAANLRGIDSTTALDGDTYEVTNVGANTLTITNQDANPAAADRIIIGAHAGALAPDETVAFRRDTATARWRIVGV